MPDSKISKRDFLKSAAAAAIMPLASAASRSVVAAPSGRPNIVLICTDDLGYGDISPYASSFSVERTTARYGALAPRGSNVYTPNLNRMAQEGALLQHFNASAPVCSPSRAGLLTGRYPARTGVVDVLFPNDKIGLPASETTIANMLKPLGYKTIAVGKWHLGDQQQFLPTNRGFDEFYGLPYSHDMSPLPLMHNTQVIEDPANLNTLTRRYTEQAVAFIAGMKNSPFFLYMAHNMPHIPLVVGEHFRGKSGMGPYGDAVQEIDWSVGQILKALVDNGLDANTFVIFTSDHGPWYQGSTGNLTGRKGDTFEGGVRVPFIARFPGQIPSGLVSQELTSNMDVLPTIAALTGAPLPANPLDGVNIWPLLSGQNQTVSRDVLLYFNCWSLQAARLGGWKLHIARLNSAPWGPVPAGGRVNLPLPRPELYHLNFDPSERYDLAADEPEIVSGMLARVEALLPSFGKDVNGAWNYTMSLKVENTPPGALPVLQNP